MLGFAGSPWTLANYMIGGNSQDTMLARRLYHEDPALFECLMEKLTDAVADYLEMQIEAGADAVQIFDSMGGCLPPTYYNQASGKWIGEIISRLAGKAPVIVFAKGTLGSFGHLVETGAQFLSMDWTVDLGEIRNRIPEQMGLQGNLDPAVLTSTPVKLPQTKPSASSNRCAGFIVIFSTLATASQKMPSSKASKPSSQP